MKVSDIMTKEVLINLKNLGLSTTIILASFLIESHSYFSFASPINHKISTSYNNHLIAQTRTHRVQLGNTLGGIANKYGISLNQLLNYNPQLKSRPNLIYVGENINLTAVISSSRKERSYTVVPGDTLGEIAIRHGLSLIAILDYNPHLASRPNQINVGEKITVGSAQIRRPATSDRQGVIFQNLPKERRLGSNNLGGKRGPTEEVCTQGRENLRAIAPPNGLGFTFDDYPYFFWYFPGVTTAKDIDFLIFQVIRQDNDNLEYNRVYKQKLELSESGIIAFSLPPQKSQPLKEGQEYIWRIRIKCSPNTTMNLSYSIKRQYTNNPKLISKLETASLDQHPLIFAESGVWFDALKMIALQLEQIPGDTTLTEDWNNILKLIGFEDLIGQPILYIDSNFE